MMGTSNTLLNIGHLFTRTIVSTAAQVQSLLYIYNGNKSHNVVKRFIFSLFNRRHMVLVSKGISFMNLQQDTGREAM
ncbi:hypothetical protein L6452_00654 [Arctium lappa]|uniref:Uncharacterized protein n=1 Tax=Arctium lappa TaxID=4217 RepID=A0ACB9FFC1_ARCLA|nr:hypothetical protein L6452_00654 [Arctium lappa]